MKLVVFGANGQTGRLVVERALSQGIEVTAVVRRPSEFMAGGENLDVAQADARDYDSLGEVVRGHDAVISAIGGSGYTKERVSVYSETAHNITRCMAENGVNKFACIGTTGSTFEIPAGESLLRRFLLYPMLFRMGKTAYEDNARMEAVIEASEVDWTVLRAAGLFNAGEVSEYEIREPGRAPAHYTSRIDLSDALLSAVSNADFSQKVLEVVTVQDTPRLSDVLRREAIGRAK